MNDRRERQSSPFSFVECREKQMSVRMMMMRRIFSSDTRQLFNYSIGRQSIERFRFIARDRWMIVDIWTSAIVDRVDSNMLPHEGIYYGIMLWQIFERKRRGFIVYNRRLMTTGAEWETDEGYISRMCAKLSTKCLMSFFEQKRTNEWWWCVIWSSCFCGEKWMMIADER